MGVEARLPSINALKKAPYGSWRHSLETLGLEGRSQRAGVGLEPDPSSRGLGPAGRRSSRSRAAAPDLNLNRRSAGGVGAVAAQKIAAVCADVGADDAGGHGPVFDSL